MLLTVVHLPKCLKKYSTLTEQKFPVKIHFSTASEESMSVSISQVLSLPASGFPNNNERKSLVRQPKLNI